MYPNHNQPPVPSSQQGWIQPPYPYHQNSNHAYQYGHRPPRPPPPHTSSRHHYHPPPPPHQGHSRSPHPGYYVSGRGHHHNTRQKEPDIPTSSPPATAAAQQRPAYEPQTIHPALITPQTPYSQLSPPVTHRPSQFSPSPPTRVTSSNIASSNTIPTLAHTPNSNPDPDPPVNTSNLVMTKPPRPYTEYTMFYQLEREFILHRLLVDKNDVAAQKEQEEQAQNALFKDDPLMPQRYRTLPLRADWYISGKTKKPSKRKHRKTHGKIGFLELTRMIAARWAEVDDETRKYCKMMAAMELVKYKEDVESYNTYKAQLEKLGQVPEDVKERERKKKAKDRRREKALSVSAAKTKKNVNVSKAPVAKQPPKEKHVTKDEVDNDMEQYITSLVHEDAEVGKKRVASSPLPLLPSNEAPWNHFMPGSREQSRSFMPTMLPPPMMSTMTTVTTTSSTKVITPERSSKRRRLPVHRHSPGSSHSRLITHPANNGAVVSSGPISPNDDELIHMTFSGIDEAEIAREFYLPSDAMCTSSPRAAVASFPGRDDAAAHPTSHTTEALYGPPVGSFDYWDAIMDPSEQAAKDVRI